MDSRMKKLLAVVAVAAGVVVLSSVVMSGPSASALAAPNGISEDDMGFGPETAADPVADDDTLTGPSTPKLGGSSLDGSKSGADKLDDQDKAELAKPAARPAKAKKAKKAKKVAKKKASKTKKAKKVAKKKAKKAKHAKKVAKKKKAKKTSPSSAA